MVKLVFSTGSWEYLGVNGVLAQLQGYIIEGDQ